MPTRQELLTEKQRLEGMIQQAEGPGLLQRATGGLLGGLQGNLGARGVTTPAVAKPEEPKLGFSSLFPGGSIQDIQKQLGPGVSVVRDGVTITGTKVGETQKKEINEAVATRGTISRVIQQSQNVPDIGGIGLEGATTQGGFRGILENVGSGIVGLLPRGTEGRARAGISENISAGEGGGISGMTTEQDENLRTYLSNLDTNGGAVYKALSGDTGRLSDFDIERGKNLMWRPDKGETTGVRDKKNKILQEAGQEREDAIRQGQFSIDPQTGAILTPQVLEGALDKLAGASVDRSGTFDEGLDSAINSMLDQLEQG